MKLKRIFYGLIVMVFMITLVGCNQNQENNEIELDIPTVTGYIDNTVYWKSVDNCNSYVVEVNEIEYSVNELQYKVDFEQEQKFTFRVKAKGNMPYSKDSNWSELLTYQFKNTEPIEVLSYDETNFTKDMKTTFADVIEKDSSGDEVFVNKRYVAKEQIENVVFMQYYIGSIQNLYIQNVSTPVFNDGSIQEIEYKEGTITSETITKGISNAVSTTDSSSTTTSKNKKVSWGFGVSHSKSLSVSVALFNNLLNIGGSETFQKTFNFGKENETTTSETIASSVTKDISNSFSSSKLEQKIKETTYKFNMENYEKGYYYTLALLADIEVYQIIGYDINTKDLFTTYFITSLTDSNTGFKVVSSKNISFEIAPDYKVRPITEMEVLENVEVEPSKPMGDTTNFIGGLGTEENPYLVATSKHLKNINLFPSACFKIIADIEVDKSFEMISEFSGVLDGDNHKLSFKNRPYTLEFERIGNAQFGGLIKNNKGNIVNLNIDGLNLKSNEDCHAGTYLIEMGGVVGVNHSEGKIENVVILNGDFICDRNNSAFGVICGTNYGIVNQCSVVQASIYATGDCGGIVGRLLGGKVTNCEFSGSIGLWIANDNGGETLRSWGGIIGWASGLNDNAITISNCHVSSCIFNYRGENPIYHKYTIFGIHHYCNLQPKIGVICESFDNKNNSVFEDCSFNATSCPTSLNLAGGDFHNGDHERRYLFAYLNGMIGYISQ